ncbi:hypothetical protein NL676_035234 [Syzygium grande]|nr:hypothetical protein NL676_035234 [Syzygium grande]
MNRTSTFTQRYEASLPGGGRDVVVPVVGAGSYGDPAGLEVGEAEVSLMLKIDCTMPAVVPLISQASLVDYLMGDHLVLEQVDDEEAEMVLIGRILLEKCLSRAA